MTTPFYAPPESFRGSTVVFLSEEAHHAARVLRHAPGDVVAVVDGEGGWHHVRLDQVDPRQVLGTVLDTRHDVGEPIYRLSIGLGMLKNRNRFETFLEKAVELGISEVAPLLTERTERERMKEPRAHNIVVAAMKQCRRCRLVDLREPRDLADVLPEEAELKLICHEQADPEAGILRMLERFPACRRLRVLVGPEGGFTHDEVERAVAAGYRTVSLGPRRLRAETAALTAAAAVMLAYDTGRDVKRKT